MEPRPPLRRVVRLLVAAVVVGAGADVVLGALDFAPDHLGVLLVSVAGGAVAAVLLGTQSTSPTWERRYDRPTVPSGQDVRTSTYVRVLESNRSAATAEPALRERLRTLTAQTLAVRHGVRPDDPAARAHVGPRLAAVLDGPARRLSVAELDACLDEIEGL